MHPGVRYQPTLPVKTALGGLAAKPSAAARFLFPRRICLNQTKAQAGRVPVSVPGRGRCRAMSTTAGYLNSSPYDYSIMTMIERILR